MRSTADNNLLARIRAHFVFANSKLDNLHDLIIISGISGAGKTTLARALVSHLGSDYKFVDADAYYMNAKPRVTLSNGQSASNWDCFEAMDPDFPQHIASHLTQSHVVLAGFALPDEILPVRPLAHIHLLTAYTATNLEQRCLQARAQAKSIDVDKDQRMVREYVIPFYHDVVRISNITSMLDVYDQESNQRYTVEQLIETLLEDDSLKPHEPQTYAMDIAQPYNEMIRRGSKVCEGRKLFGSWIKLRVGDKLLIVNKDDEHDRPYYAEITSIARYLPSLPDPAAAMVRNEELSRILPNIKTVEEGVKVYRGFSSAETIAKMGMMSIVLKLC